MTKIETDFWQDQIAGLNDKSLTAMMDYWFYDNLRDWVLGMRKRIEAEWPCRANAGRGGKGTHGAGGARERGGRAPGGMVMGPGPLYVLRRF